MLERPMTTACLPSVGDTIPLKQGHDACRGRWNKTGQTQCQISHVDGMETIDIFLRSNGLGDGLGIEVVGEGELNNEPIDVWVFVQAADNLKQFRLLNVCRPHNQGAFKPHARTAAHFVVYVSLAGTVFTDEDSSKVGGTVTLVDPSGDFLGDFFFDLLGEAFAVKDASGFHSRGGHRDMWGPFMADPRPIMLPKPRRLPPEPLIIFIIFFISPNCLTSWLIS